MKQMLMTLSVYAIAYFALLVVVLGMLYIHPKLELHLLLNAHHTSILDTFFKYYSTLAEWPLYICALLPMLKKKFRLTLFFGLCELTGGALLQILKHTISTERPVSAFDHYHDIILPLVQGVDMHHSNSFPSGHASTFFVFFTCSAILVAYHYRHKMADHHKQLLALLTIGMLMLMFLMFATLGAYSRVYLSQHFLSDVCVGSIIGFITPCLIFYFGRNKILKLKLNDIKNDQTIT